MSATFAKGTQLRVGDGAAVEVFTTIPLVRNITGPSNTADELDATTHDTPGAFRDKMQGLKDHGSISFEILADYTQALHQQIYADFVAGTERNYSIVFPDVGTTTFAFRGFVKSCAFAAPHDELLTQSVEIVIKGTPQPTLS